MNEHYFQIALHHFCYFTFCKMCLPRGAEKLDTDSLTKLCQEEKQRARSAFLAVFQKSIKTNIVEDAINFKQINHQPRDTQLTKRSYAGLSDLGSSSMTFFLQLAVRGEGGVLML